MTKRKTTNEREIPTWTTRRMKVSELRPADYNPRKISERALEGLRASLARFGDMGGIVWNERTNRLVGGHQRVKVLVQLGVEEVDVRVVDLDEASEKAANITLNNSLIGGEWDEALLRAVLEEAKRDMPTAFEELHFSDLAVLDVEPELEPSPSDLSYEAKRCPHCGEALP
jgi:ParB-like chromosome segregation protein Spo0J